jgi:hypothetical protein
MARRVAKPKRNLPSSEYVPDTSEFLIECGGGRGVRVPTYEARDFHDAREERVHLPDLAGYPSDAEKDLSAPRGVRRCYFCGGSWTRDRKVEGGLRLHLALLEDRWYSFARPCPRCVFGGYRRLAMPKTPWASQFMECSASEIGIFWSLFRNGNLETGQSRTATLRSALDSLTEQEMRRGPSKDRDIDYVLGLHGRLSRGIEQLEAEERREVGRDRQATDAF